MKIEPSLEHYANVLYTYANAALIRILSLAKYGIYNVSDTRVWQNINFGDIFALQIHSYHAFESLENFLLFLCQTYFR